MSFLKRFNETDNDTLEYYIRVFPSDDPDGDWVDLIHIYFNFDELVNENESMLQNIKSKIKEQIKKKKYYYAFHNQPI